MNNISFLQQERTTNSQTFCKDLLSIARTLHSKAGICLRSKSVAGRPLIYSGMRLCYRKWETGRPRYKRSTRRK